MGAVRTQAIGRLRRRRVQAVIVGSILLVASAAATTALDTLVESQAPYDHAFAQANGAHLVLDYDGRLATTDLVTTAGAAVVTGSAGPWPVAQAGFVVGPAGASGRGKIAVAGGISGRSTPDTAVDQVTLSAGRWWRAPGEIVLSQSRAQSYGASIGDTIELQQAPRDGTRSKLPDMTPPGTTGTTGTDL